MTVNIKLTYIVPFENLIFPPQLFQMAVTFFHQIDMHSHTHYFTTEKSCTHSWTCARILMSQKVFVTLTNNIRLLIWLCCLLGFVFSFHQAWLRVHAVLILSFGSTLHAAKEWPPGPRTQSCWCWLILGFKWKTSFCINQPFPRCRVWRWQLLLNLVDVFLVHKIKKAMPHKVRL